MALADFHCDLLCYLANNPHRTPFDLQARCSLPQLQQAGLTLQTLAIYTETEKGSSHSGMAQLEAFQRLVTQYPEKSYALKTGTSIDSSRIGFSLATENGSALCDEEEPLDRLFERITHIERHFAKIAYLSLTWNQENRFGGGAHAPAKLKVDGKQLLEFLSGRRMAIDLSHASDVLAEDILNEIDRYGYHIPVVASHSNFRTITPVARNLPDRLVKEIERRQGMIGFNFYRPFVGEESSLNFVHHLEYALQKFSPKMLCLGADFFYEDDVPSEQRKRADELYFPEACHAGVAYDYVLNLWKKHLNLNPSLIQGIAYQHLHHFFTTQIL